MEIKNQENRNIYYCFGYKVFGPFLYGFARWLKTNIDTIGFKKVFFFSRDGYMMKKAFDQLDNGKNISEYVYFSRKSLRQALLWKTESLEESLKYLGWERYLSVGKILEYFGFDETERKRISMKYNINHDRDIAYDDISKDGDIIDFYHTYRDDIVKKSKKQADLLLKYIQQIGMEGQCAIVDIGWHGSMQYYLELFLEENGIDTAIEGYYVGILPNVPLGTQTHGYVYSENNPSRRKEVLCFFGGYERLFQGFDGSTAGYDTNRDGLIVPVLAHYEYGQEKDQLLVDHIKEWQRGALDFIKEDKEELNDRDLMDPLIQFGKAPSLSDTKIFSGFYTYDGSQRFFICSKKLRDYKIKEFLHDLSNSQWKTGFLKSAFRIPFPYFWIYEVLRK